MNRAMKYMAGFCLGLGVHIASADVLTVTVSNVSVGKGDVRVGLFDKSDPFPNGTYFNGEVAESTADSVTVVFKDLKSGTFAVSLYQDTNGNKELDKNRVGIPKEPYGFSGNLKSGGSTFEKPSFQLNKEGTTISIKLKK